MSLAPLAYTLYQRIMNVDPNDPHWAGRDRFVLSCGHSSLTQYIQLYLAGFGLEMDDLKSLRTWGAKTPGHPEYRHTDGVEITTGPLGQGLASAVGMAMASRRERGLFDPNTPQGESPFDHYIYVICSDGDIEEGVTSEACSLAGTQQLGNLIVFWDDNHISIEEDTQIAFTEDVVARYKAYGWQTLEVGGGEDVAAIERAVKEAQANTSQPTLIRVRTIIGYPAPTMMNTGAVHGAALGAEEVAATKRELGFDPEVNFFIADDVINHTRKAAERGAEKHAEWQKKFDAWAAANPEHNALFERLSRRELPEGWADDLPVWEPDAKGVATRKASEATLQALGATLPELWGGSADLAGSNNTVIKGEPSFGPEDITTETWSTNPYGRNLHFGIREHGMGAIMNGLALHGGVKPFGATFLMFSEYERNALRMAALMKINPVFVFTHDSIGLGEDGPTHQPIEQTATLRLIPNMDVWRPCDTAESLVAWAEAAKAEDHPSCLIFSRQNLKFQARSEQQLNDIKRGGYVISEAQGNAQAVIIATGSEVELALEAQKVLAAQNIAVRVVSMPSTNVFDRQDAAYKAAVLPEGLPRVAVEAGHADGWYKYVGLNGAVVGINRFGESAPAELLFKEFGFTVDNVVDTVKSVL